MLCDNCYLLLLLFSKLTLTHVSEDGNEGYPGDVMARVTFELKNDNSFRITYAATTSKPTPINLTQFTYFNLAGHVRIYKINILNLPYYY